MRQAFRALGIFTLLIAIPAIARVDAPLIGPGKSQAWEDAVRLRAREFEAFVFLRQTNTFEMPHVGYGDVRSRGYLAMRILGRSPYADAAFKKLLDSSSPVGQLYGLIGVWRTDPVYFQSAMTRYTGSKESVIVFAGCIIDSDFVGDLVCGRIADGSYTRAFLDREFDEEEARADEAECDFSM